MAFNVESPGIFRKIVNIDPASVAAGRSNRQDVTVSGVQPGMILAIRPVAALTAGLEVLGLADCFTAGTLTVTFVNTSAAPIDNAAADFMVVSL
jgi:hypothetical protein